MGQGFGLKPDAKVEIAWHRCLLASTKESEQEAILASGDFPSHWTRGGLDRALGCLSSSGAFPQAERRRCQPRGCSCNTAPADPPMAPPAGGVATRELCVCCDSCKLRLLRFV
eukprot:3224554-Alexandrium_andersonii.AAC.1